MPDARLATKRTGVSLPLDVRGTNDVSLTPVVIPAQAGIQFTVAPRASTGFPPARE